MPHTQDLAFFVLLARHATLAAAAQELGVTPPAVSRRLASLEERLGVHLLHRTTRRLRLTPEGERYAEEALRILNAVDALERSLVASRNVPRGLLRVNATFGFGRRHLSPAISDFIREYPDIEVILQLTDRPLDLAGDAMDIGVRIGPPPDARVLARKLASNRRLLCAAPGYVAAHGAPQFPRELTNHPCIVIRENDSTFNNWHLVNGMRQETVKVHGPLSTNLGEIAVDWALAGHGILLRSEWDIADKLHSGALVRVLAPWVGGSADVHAVYPERHQQSAKVRAFLDFLGKRFAAHPPGGNNIS